MKRRYNPGDLIVMSEISHDDGYTGVTMRPVAFVNGHGKMKFDLRDDRGETTLTWDPVVFLVTRVGPNHYVMTSEGEFGWITVSDWAAFQQREW